MEEAVKKFLHGCGSGNGCGSGDGSSKGNGSGNGSGRGSGYGSGSGDGYGSGSGRGSGYGSGYGSGCGCGDGCGLKIEMYEGKPLLYIDGLPCVFVSVHGFWAAVRIIDGRDFTSRQAFLGKWGGCLAHGETIREAILDAKKKFYSSMDFERVRKLFLAEFSTREKLTVRELHTWHGILTGSCRLGRTEFQERHGLKDDDELTLKEFIDITKDAYGGDRILQLEEGA